MLDFFVGFLTSILSGLGIGGGGLLVIWLVLVRGGDQLASQGINLVFFLFSSSAAMIVHLMKRRINWYLVGYMILSGSVGALIGSVMAKNIAPETIRLAFGMLLIISGTITLFKKNKPRS